MKMISLATFTFCAGLAVAHEPMLVSWQTKSRFFTGFAEDMTIEGVRFADTNGFDFVRFVVDKDTKLRPLLEALGDRLGAWIEFTIYTTPLVKSVVGDLKELGIGTNRVVLAAGKRWMLEDLKAHYSEYRRVWPGRFEYAYANNSWRLFAWPTGPDYCANAVEVAAAIEKYAKTYDLWGVEFLCRDFVVEPEVISRLHAVGIKLALNGVNNPTVGDYYRDAKADVFISSLPAYTHGGSWPKGEPKPVKYIGHRGGEDYLAPQHSPAMARLAVEKRLPIIKLDIHWTKDGEIITQHDHTMKSVFGVDLDIHENTYAELSKYEAKPVNGITGQHLATFRQILQIAKSDIKEFWIDFKDFSPEFAEKAVSIIDDEKIEHSRIMVATFRPDALEYMRDHHPEIRRVLHVATILNAGKWRLTYRDADFPDVNGVIDEIANRQRRYRLFGVNMPNSTYTTDHAMIGKLKKMGLWISIYFPVDPVSADYYRRAGVDAFVTGSVRACEKRGTLRAQEASLR